MVVEVRSGLTTENLVDSSIPPVNPDDLERCRCMAPRHAAAWHNKLTANKCGGYNHSAAF